VIEHSSFKSAFEVCLSVLRGVDINHHVKLDRDYAPAKINEFAKKYNITPPKSMGKTYDQRAKEKLQEQFRSLCSGAARP